MKKEGYGVNRKITKITISVTENLLERIEEYANSLNINRSSAVSVLISQALEQKEAVNVLDTLQKSMNDWAARQSNKS